MKIGSQFKYVELWSLIDFDPNTPVSCSDPYFNKGLSFARQAVSLGWYPILCGDKRDIGIRATVELSRVGGLIHPYT